MRISPESLVAKAEATGFRPDVLEKVAHLLALLEALAAHLFLRGKLAHKGGTEVPGSLGYYALAIGFPMPYWILVPASKLVDRPPMPNILLEALSDKELSAEWTHEYIKIPEGGCRRVKLASFVDLKQMALSGRRILGG